MSTCRKCREAELELKTKDSDLNLDGRQVRVVGVAYLKCPNCGYESIPADLARSNDRKFVDARRVALGLLTSAEIAQARHKHGLTQVACSRLFGGGPNSFNKYESGAVTQSEAMDLLIRLMRDVPNVLSYIAELKGIDGIKERHVVPDRLFQSAVVRSGLVIVADGAQPVGVQELSAHFQVGPEVPAGFDWKAG